MPTVTQVSADIWDKFVEGSPQGTIFSTTKWLDLFETPYTCLMVYKGEEAIGGIAGFEKEGFHSCGPLTQFMGVLYKPNDGKYTTRQSLEWEVQDTLIGYLNKYEEIEIANHYTVQDIRPFLWAGYTPSVRYTYVLQIDCTDIDLEKQTRYEITKVQKQNPRVFPNWTMRSFAELYRLTFERKGMSVPMSDAFLDRLDKSLHPEIRYVDNGEDRSATVVIKDSKRAYYILGASTGHGSSSLAVWDTIVNLANQGVKELDFVGCNDQKIALFKRGFGGTLCPYYFVKGAIV